MSDDSTTTRDIGWLQTTNAELDAMDEAELLERVRVASNLCRHHERQARIARNLLDRYMRTYRERRGLPAPAPPDVSGRKNAR